jgi:hypothetical protein
MFKHIASVRFDGTKELVLSMRRALHAMLSLCNYTIEELISVRKQARY